MRPPPPRFLLPLALALSCGGPTQVAADSATARPTPPPEPEAPASPLTIEPLLVGAFATGAERWARGDAAGARRELVAAIAGAPTDERTRAARLVAALAALETGDAPAGRRELEDLAAEWPLVAPLALAHAARAAMDAGVAADAEALAARVPDGSPWAAIARLVQADAAYARGDWATAEVRYRRIADDPAAPRRLQARRRLGEAIARQIRPGTRDAARAARAIEELAAVAQVVPGTRLGHELDLRIASLARQLSARERARLVASPEDALRRAQALLDEQKSEDAEKTLKALLRALPARSPHRCPAQLALGESVMRQRERARAVPLLEEAVRACRERPEEARALYLSGKTRAAIGRHQEAIDHFGALEARHTASTLTDDARLLAAQSALALGQVDGFRERLSSLPDAYPEGDMAGEALWQLAWQAWRGGDLPAALRALDALEARFPRENGWWAAGRAPYWRGRVLERMGRRADALVSLQKAIRDFPLSYYMLLALSRVAALDRPTAEALWTELATDRAPAPGLPAAPAPEVLEGEGFVRAKVLLRAGLGDLASRELAALGIDGTAARPEDKWLAAYLLDRAGDPVHAHDILRRRIPEFARAWPSGDARRKWLVAYPRPFADLVTAAATEHGLPEALVYAIVREESGFSPRVESWANAVGLTQLMPATARRFGAPLGLPVTSETLRDPATNLRIGGAFLAFLRQRFAGSPLLVAAGYNAGETAVKRWLDAAPAAELDELVEAIPYDETRGYAKRVAASWATYHALYGDGTPPLVSLAR